MGHGALRAGLPLLAFALFIGGWEWAVAYWQIKPIVLPAPSAILDAAIVHCDLLMLSAWNTLKLSMIAFVLVVTAGVFLAALFSQSRILEHAFFPYAVILQVTPIVAIAPLIQIWVGIENVETALVLLAFIAAFFPVLSNMTIGLRAADRGLMDLFRLHGAGRIQTFFRLQLPASLPFLLSGMKVSGGLSVIGLVVAEFVAGSGQSGGLAWRIIEAGNRLQVARMFAALVFLSVLGLAIYGLLRVAEHLLLRRWHAGDN